MTALSIPCAPSRPTGLDLVLLRLAHGIDAFVMHRLERRSRATSVTASAGAHADDDRRTALALGGLGILPR
jgi:hypothetical protein